MSSTADAVRAELDRQYPLPETAAADFARDGFAHLSRVLSPRPSRTSSRLSRPRCSG